MWTYLTGEGFMQFFKNMMINNCKFKACFLLSLLAFSGGLVYLVFQIIEQYKKLINTKSSLNVSCEDVVGFCFYHPADLATRMASAGFNNTDCLDIRKNECSFIGVAVGIFSFAVCFLVVLRIAYAEKENEQVKPQVEDKLDVVSVRSDVEAGVGMAALRPPLLGSRQS